MLLKLKKILISLFFFLSLSNYSVAQTQFADVLVEAKLAENSFGYVEFYGGKGSSFPFAVKPEVVLGNDPYFLSLPTNSYVIVQFTDNLVVDRIGDDLFIEEAGGSGEFADVYISYDGKNFSFLGRAQDNGITSFDLAKIGFPKPVRFVKVVGLDERGGSPGFDLVSIYALPSANENVFKNISELSDKIKNHESLLFNKLSLYQYHLNEKDFSLELTHLIASFAKFLKNNPELRIKIVGHTEVGGNKDMNLLISAEKAREVYQIFLKYGISPNRMQYEGRGGSQPLNQDDNPESRAANRRIEIEFLAE